LGHWHGQGGDAGNRGGSPSVLAPVRGDQFSGEHASAVRILYGGSVKPENIQGLLAPEELDGALVGGASLVAESFAQIVNCP